VVNVPCVDRQLSVADHISSLTLTLNYVSHTHRWSPVFQEQCVQYSIRIVPDFYCLKGESPMKNWVPVLLHLKCGKYPCQYRLATVYGGVRFSLLHRQTLTHVPCFSLLLHMCSQNPCRPYSPPTLHGRGGRDVNMERGNSQAMI